MVMQHCKNAFCCHLTLQILPVRIILRMFDHTTRIVRCMNQFKVCVGYGVCVCCRWESSPWTACSTSCGGGMQSRSVSCVEEDMQGNINPTDEWKCLYASKTPILQPCNTFDCPTWLAQEWSPVFHQFIYSLFLVLFISPDI